MVQGKINRGRHTDHLAGCHSIRTKQCPPPPFSHFSQAGCPSCHPTNSVKAEKQPQPKIYETTKDKSILGVKAYPDFQNIMAGKKHKNSKNVKNGGKVTEFKLQVKIQNYLHYNE